VDIFYNSLDERMEALVNAEAREETSVFYGGKESQEFEALHRARLESSRGGSRGGTRAGTSGSGGGNHSRERTPPPASSSGLTPPPSATENNDNNDNTNASSRSRGNIERARSLDAAFAVDTENFDGEEAAIEDLSNVPIPITVSQGDDFAQTDENGEGAREAKEGIPLENTPGVVRPVTTTTNLSRLNTAATQGTAGSRPTTSQRKGSLHFNTLHLK